MEPMRCFTCGFPISNIKEAFDYARRLKLAKLREKNPENRVHPDFNIMAPFAEADMGDIFAALGVDKMKYCCKAKLTTNVQFHDLEVQDRF